jgi:hypothetical protein
VLGKFKDKPNGKIKQEFVWLRAKFYAYKIFEKIEKKPKKQRASKKCCPE